MIYYFLKFVKKTTTTEITNNKYVLIISVMYLMSFLDQESMRS